MSEETKDFSVILGDKNWNYKCHISLYCFPFKVNAKGLVPRTKKLNDLKFREEKHKQMNIETRLAENAMYILYIFHSSADINTSSLQSC